MIDSSVFNKSSVEIIWSFEGVIKQDDIGLSILIEAEKVDYKYTEGGFQTLIYFNDVDKLERCRGYLKDIEDNLDKYCLPDGSEFTFKLC